MNSVRVYRGIGGSEGTALGVARVVKQADTAISSTKIATGEVQGEKDKLKNAHMLTCKQIKEIRAQAAAVVGEEKAQIFDAHLMMLEDDAFIGEMISMIERDHVRAAMAVEEVSRTLVALFKGLDDDYTRERASDIEDVATRLKANLGGEQTCAGSREEGAILVAYDLAPSATILLDKQQVKGFITAVGNKISHAAIIAGALGIPAVLGLADATDKIKDGELLLIDGYTGEVVVNPVKEMVDQYKQKAANDEIKVKTLRERFCQPVQTNDGRRVIVAANIGSAGEADGVIANGGDGIGLYRTEMLYMNRKDLPSEEELFASFRSVVRKMDEKPVIIRTLDIGGDKGVECLSLPAEANPFLGLRGIRLCLARPDIFKTQLRAILRASVYGHVKLMYPMISCVGEVRAANTLLAEAKAELSVQNRPFAENIEVGVMIEVPAAALSADIIAEEVDFFSIGTNDLCQYALAIDRTNERVAAGYQPFHPAIFRLIRQVIEAAHARGKSVGMCGEMAANPAAAILLLGLGLDEFSVSPPAINKIKAIICGSSYEKGQEAVKPIFTMATPQEIEKYATSLLADILAK
jgi:phosphotransferase system enzyme I (PtsI)